MGADIHQPRDHAPTDPKREVGAVARLDFAGQRERSLSVLRLHNFGAYERGTLHRIGGVVVAGAQWRRQKRDREYGIPCLSSEGGWDEKGGTAGLLFIQTIRYSLI